jgi:hypothetical protein
MSPTNRYVAIALSFVIGGCGSTDDESVAASAATNEPTTLGTATSAVDATEAAASDTTAATLPEAVGTTDSDEVSPAPVAGLWSEGLINLRNGELPVFAGGEHELDPATVSAGYNVVADAEGNLLAPSGVP